MFFIFWNKLVLFRNVFYLPKKNVFSQKSSTIKFARLAEKNHMFVFGNALPKSNARAHLKQRKNIVAEIYHINRFPTKSSYLKSSDWSCVSLPRATTSSGWELQIFVYFEIKHL